MPDEDGRLETAVAEKVPRTRIFKVMVEGTCYEVQVEEVSATPFTSAKLSVCATGSAPRQKTSPTPKRSTPLAVLPKPQTPPTAKATPLIAPMPGVIVRHEKHTGDSVNAGDVIVVLDAMKMQNSIITASSGKVVSIHCEPGQMVKKGAVLAVIA